MSVSITLNTNSIQAIQLTKFIGKGMKNIVHTTRRIHNVTHQTCKLMGEVKHCLQHISCSTKSLSLFILCAWVMVSCMPYTPSEFHDQSPTEDNKPNGMKPASEYFDFNTSEEVTFNIDYGKMGSRALIEVSVDDPTIIDDNDGIYYQDNAIFKSFCDENGRFNGKVVLPTYADSVYIYTMRAGLPTLMRAKVDGGRVEMKLDYQAPATRVVVSTDYGGREAGDEFEEIVQSNGYKIWRAPTKYSATNIYTIVNWEGSRFGQVISFDKDDPYYYWGNDYEGGDNQGLINNGDFDDPYEIDELQYFLWNKSTIKPPSGLPNKDYRTPTEVVNTVIPEEALGENGELLDGVEVWLTFISEAAQNQNAIGYYYYKTGEAPSSASDIKAIYIAIPNASIGEEKPFITNYFDKTYKMYEAMYAPLAPNKRVQLLYHDEENQTVSKKFPLGYTIGYFIASAETKPRMGTNPMTNKTMKIHNQNGLMFYSNSEYNGNVSRFIALNTQDKVIYGMEDGGISNGKIGDESYEDILFTIETNPKGIAINDQRTTVDIDKLIVDEVTNKTYAYEDIWPDGGDYDMNDVVIDHQHTVSFIQDDNKDASNSIVTKIEDSFTVRQPSNAATYVDAFAIQLPEGTAYEYSRITTSEGAIYEDDTRSIILFTHAMRELGKTFTVTRYFDGKNITKGQVPLETTGADGVIRNTLNPYIISRYDLASAEARTEIHLPKHSATRRAHTGKIGAGDDAYYINKDNKHPFAISLPFSVTAEWGKHFTLPTGEGVEIGKAYPNFDRWVESNGTECQDWYLHPSN